MDEKGLINSQQHVYKFQDVVRKAREIWKAEKGEDFKD